MTAGRFLRRAEPKDQTHRCRHPRCSFFRIRYRRGAQWICDGWATNTNTDPEIRSNSIPCRQLWTFGDCYCRSCDGVRTRWHPGDTARCTASQIPKTTEPY